MLDDVQDLNLKELESCCGVGVVVTPAQVEEAVEAELAKVKEEILAKRYRFNTGLLMANVRCVCCPHLSMGDRRGR